MKNSIIMKTKVNIDDFLNIIYWVKISFVMDGKKFKYDNLLEQAETYKLSDTPLDIKIHHIDELMIDAFKIYFKLKESDQKSNELIDAIQLPSYIKEGMISETNKYKRIFEDLLENYKYEDPEIKGIQKGFLSEKIKEYIAVEDYENAAKIRDIINEI